MALQRLASEVALRSGLRLAPASFAAVSGSSFSAALQSFVRQYSAPSPADLKFAKSHEWVKVSGDTATVGISDHAQEALGEVVYLELPEVGSEVNKGKSFGVVESVKAASDVYSPVSGEVLEVNGDLTDEANLAQVNKDPYNAWFMKVKVSNPGDLGDTMSAEEYDKFIEDS